MVYPYRAPLCRLYIVVARLLMVVRLKTTAITAAIRNMRDNDQAPRAIGFFALGRRRSMKIEEQVRRACPYKAMMLIIARRRPKAPPYTPTSPDSTLIESIRPLTQRWHGCLEAAISRSGDVDDNVRSLAASHLSSSASCS